MKSKIKYGLLIDYEYCTGCYACQVACAQEHNWPEGVVGIEVIKIIQKLPNSKASLSFVPFPTRLCSLCANRTIKGLLPVCVQHCMARCMKYGSIKDLVKDISGKKRMVLWTQR
jgi:Fe-S-cluster-containing dehydrogenase component